MTDDEIDEAFRGRMKAQALYDRVGKGVEPVTAYRFADAGNWERLNPPGLPGDLLEVVKNDRHPRRYNLPPGPIMAVHVGKTLEIVEPLSLFLRPELEMRRAVFEFFDAAKNSERPWLSPFALQVISEERQRVLSSSRGDWIAAGLRLHDVIRDDFFANLAGLKQTAAIRYEDGYEEFLRRVLRPPSESFDHVSPPFWSSAAQREGLGQQIESWVSGCARLEDALARYYSHCGHLPLRRDDSATRLVERWHDKSSGTDVWVSTWAWATAARSPVARYHACRVFVDHPEWIPPEKGPDFWQEVLSILRSANPQDASSSQPLWRVRIALARHFAYHLESLGPGLESTMAAGTAWWIGEKVARVIGINPAHAEQCRSELIEPETDLSRRRWTIARSAVPLSPLRNVTLFSPSMWADACLNAVMRNWAALPTASGPVDLRESILKMASDALCSGRLVTSQRDAPAFAFEEHIDSTVLAPFLGAAAEQTGETSTERFLRARTIAESPDGLRELLEILGGSDEDVALFCCWTLRSLTWAYGIQNELVKEFLQNGEWRAKCFQGRAETTLEAAFVFLLEWQLQQRDEWHVRIPHFVAYECERAQENDRRRFLFGVTVLSSIIADVASPVVRLLVGSGKELFVEEAQEWMSMLTLVARESEEWLASRIRAFVGSISRHV